MVDQNKIFSFKMKRQAKNVLPSDVEGTVGDKLVISMILTGSCV